MGDVGQDMKALRAGSQARRGANRERAPELLTAAGISFTTHNGGAHLIVAREWNCWPGTGRWCHRGPPVIDGRGIQNLIDRIKTP